MNGDRYHLVELPMGWMVLLGGEDGLKRASLKPTPQEAIEDMGMDLDGADDDPDAFTEVVECLHRYAAGDRTALDEIGLDFTGITPFFSAAWNWLAAEAGSPLAMRAAGQAMARNRFSLIIPCHRVIASDGGLGGYGGGGLGVKARLLQMELRENPESAE